jgi:hypothetical protein
MRCLLFVECWQSDQRYVFTDCFGGQAESEGVADACGPLVDRIESRRYPTLPFT